MYRPTERQLSTLAYLTKHGKSLAEAMRLTGYRSAAEYRRFLGRPGGRFRQWCRRFYEDLPPRAKAALDRHE